MLEVSSISFDYEERSVFENVCFSLSPGNLLHLRGRNGAGKTTIIRLLAGLLRPTEGAIFWSNKSIYKNLFEYQQNLCYIGHKTGISQQLTIKENCLLDLHWEGTEHQLDEMLSIFQLTTNKDTLCSHLSMGQRRRVGLLRLAMTKASIWLLDEPLIALDTNSIGVLSDIFEQHLARQGLIILTSHQQLPSAFSQYQVHDL